VAQASREGGWRSGVRTRTTAMATRRPRSVTDTAVYCRLARRRGTPGPGSPEIVELGCLWPFFEPTKVVGNPVNLRSSKPIFFDILTGGCFVL